MERNLENNLTQARERETLLTPKRKMTMDMLLENAYGIQNFCKDYESVSTKKGVWLNDDLTLTFKEPDGQVFRQPLSSHAFSQLCGKAEVPTRFMKKCIDNGFTDLACDNINEWLTSHDKNLLVRTHKDKIRGILSDRYSVLDTPDILTALKDTVKDYDVKSYLITEERFHLRLTEKEMLPIEGEDLFAGLQIESSDVGRSTLTVHILIFKQVCTNGLVVSQGDGILFQQKHIGINSDDFRRGLSERIGLIPSIVADFTDMIKDSAKNSLSKSQMEKIIARFNEDTKTTEEVGEKIVSLMNDRYTTTRWGLINSITEIAQDYTLDRRVELEKYAGQLLLAS